MTDIMGSAATMLHDGLGTETVFKSSAFACTA
jgi:hypothetical protein